MDKHSRPLQDYFAAAADEPGISEHEVREILRRAPRNRAAPAWRWLGAAIGGAGAIVIAYLSLSPTSDDRTVQSTRPSSAAPSVASALGGQSVTRPNALSDDRSATTADTNSKTSSTSPISNQGGTMNGKNIVRGIATAALAMGMTTTAGAQSSEAPTKEVRKEVRVTVEHKISPAMHRMATELGQSAADFWTARLNGYKARIDRIISPNDLDNLNRLRVRFGVMLAEHADAATGTSEGIGANEEEEEVVIHRDGLGESDDATNEGGREVKREIRISMKAGGEDAMEFLGMHQGAKEIAAKYRDDFDALGRDVLSDFVTFLRQMSDAGAVFMDNNRVEIEKTEDGKQVSIALKEARDVIASLDSDEKRAMMQMVYAFAAEPLIMLYDGADLRDFFGQAGPLSSAVTGLNLPATNVLKQSAPNPAASKATIAYQLQEPSSATMLRLYDATGALIGTYDQGAREAGEHAETIDVSALSSGVYLYHLTVKTGEGERVYSKTMQVAK